MRWVMDALYLLAALVAAPLWLPRMLRRGTIRTDWRGRFGRVETVVHDHGCSRPAVLVHAVSVGEVNAIRLLVENLAARPHGPRIIVSSTTDTGVARARSLFAGRHEVVRFPLDASWAVRRFLHAVRPAAVALVELEVWPNFVRECASRDIPLAVVNGRLSGRSAARYQRIAWLIRPSFRRIAFAAVQNETYAQRFRALGVPAERIRVLGTMKWDTAQIADHVDGAEALAEALGVDRTRPLVVAGSTAPGEHALLVSAVPEGAQLLCAPRRPEWFEAAAEAMPGCARRSRGDRGSMAGRFLLDSIGELRQAYALADVVVVGRTFDPLHGSDMMEPVALGRATIVGPNVGDFQDVCEALVASGGVLQVRPEALAAAIEGLLADPRRRAAMATAGREVIRCRQGASARHADMLMDLLATRLHLTAR
jgi:3-deoxy-D-manno-octulosonic-acid transferase